MDSQKWMPWKAMEEDKATSIMKAFESVKKTFILGNFFQFTAKFFVWKNNRHNLNVKIDRRHKISR